ncbi:unnamed protein product [Cuscuta epithymum]|uniref:Uncharacterized protein n=1 Tax=Cuscuta epithymum TaxID=186058 RepID=A0AAV0CNX6_9ASTE|nr:unnamed protein product [Cuscuta epithymum]CAH9144752.1 unnamed protein product [Cuscuta epithymum]
MKFKSRPDQTRPANFTRGNGGSKMVVALQRCLSKNDKETSKTTTMCCLIKGTTGKGHSRAKGGSKMVVALQMCFSGHHKETSKTTTMCCLISGTTSKGTVGETVVLKCLLHYKGVRQRTVRNWVLEIQDRSPIVASVYGLARLKLPMMQWWVTCMLNEPLLLPLDVVCFLKNVVEKQDHQDDDAMVVDGIWPDG